MSTTYSNLTNDQLDLLLSRPLHQEILDALLEERSSRIAKRQEEIAAAEAAWDRSCAWEAATESREASRAAKARKANRAATIARGIAHRDGEKLRTTGFRAALVASMRGEYISQGQNLSIAEYMECNLESYLPGFCHEVIWQWYRDLSPAGRTRLWNDITR